MSSFREPLNGMKLHMTKYSLWGAYEDLVLLICCRYAVQDGHQDFSLDYVTNIKLNLASIIIWLSVMIFIYFYMISKTIVESGERHRLSRASSFYFNCNILYNIKTNLIVRPHNYTRTVFSSNWRLFFLNFS